MCNHDGDREHVGIVSGRANRIQFGKAAVKSFPLWWLKQHSRAQNIQGKHLNRFLKKDRTNFSKLLDIVLLCLLSTLFRMVTITAPRHAKNVLLETLFGCASGPCLHGEPHVVRTAASVPMTAFAEYFCCVRATCSELGASKAFPIIDSRNR